MKKLAVLAAFAAAVSMMNVRPASAQFEELLEKGQDLLLTAYPPEVKDVKFVQTEEGLQVIAKVNNNTNDTDDETVEVYVQHSLDGGKTWEEEVSLDSEDGKTWTGEMPSYDAGTEITYAIRAVDTSDNIYTDLACKVDAEKYPFAADDEYREADCTPDTDNLDGCFENVIPRGCMFVGAKDESPINDDKETAPKDSDIWVTRIGYDDDYLYLDLSVENEVSPGTITPADLHLYVGLIHNPDSGKLPKSTEEYKDMMNKGVLTIHAPQAVISGGLALPCSVLSYEGEELIQNEEALECNPKGTKKSDKHLFWKVKRDSYRANKSGKLDLIFLTGGLLSTNLTDSDELKSAARVYDYTHWTTVQMDKPRTYTYEEEGGGDEE